MGHVGNPNHPDVIAATLEGIRRIRAAGLPAGVLTLNPEVYDAAIKAGALEVMGPARAWIHLHRQLSSSSLHK